MHYLIMGQHQNIILTVSVAHGESHLVMVIFSEIWIQLHILQEIIHPAHIPLKSKAQPAIIHIFGHTRPCGRFLRNDHRAVSPAMNDGIQVLKEPDSIQVFISAILVRKPLSVLLSIVKIQHRSNRIYTQPINMILSQPEQGVGNEKISHL